MVYQILDRRQERGISRTGGRAPQHGHELELVLPQRQVVEGGRWCHAIVIVP